jgi:hypothetical protein
MQTYQDSSAKCWKGDALRERLEFRCAAKRRVDSHGQGICDCEAQWPSRLLLGGLCSFHMRYRHSERSTFSTVFHLSCSGWWGKGITCATYVVLLLLPPLHEHFPRTDTSDIRHVNRPWLRPYKRWPRQHNKNRTIHFILLIHCLAHLPFDKCIYLPQHFTYIWRSSKTWGRVLVRNSDP